MIKLAIITIYIACSLVCEAASPNYTLEQYIADVIKAL